MNAGRHRRPQPAREPWGWLIAAMLLAAYAGIGLPITAFLADLGKPWWLVIATPCLAGFMGCCNKALTIT